MTCQLPNAKYPLLNVWSPLFPPDALVTFRVGHINFEASGGNRGNIRVEYLLNPIQ
jgi:hypothetical protein